MASTCLESLWDLQRIEMKKFEPILCCLLWAVLLPRTTTAQPEQKQKGGWHPPYMSAKALLETYQCQKGIRNDCFLLLYGGNYLLDQQGDAADLPELLERLPAIDLSRPEAAQFAQEQGSDFADNYFMLQAMKKGASFEEARDGTSISTRFSLKALNRYDFEKLEAIFSSSNHPLQENYLGRMKFLLAHYGCSSPMLALQSIIRQHCPESPKKTEILELYRQYERISAGKAAPQPSFYDPQGHSAYLEAYAGKLIVIDVWATWCCACIEKMPRFIALQARYANRQDVAFITVSIDSEEKKTLWRKTLSEQNMNSLVNWIAPGTKSSFCRDYLISDVPRYIIIGKQGEVVNAYATWADIEALLRK